MDGVKVPIGSEAGVPIIVCSYILYLQLSNGGGGSNWDFYFLVLMLVILGLKKDDVLNKTGCLQELSK